MFQFARGRRGHNLRFEGRHDALLLNKHGALARIRLLADCLRRFRVSGSGVRVSGSGFWVSDLGLRVECSEVRISVGGVVFYVLGF